MESLSSGRWCHYARGVLCCIVPRMGFATTVGSYDHIHENIDGNYYVPTLLNIEKALIRDGQVYEILNNLFSVCFLFQLAVHSNIVSRAAL